MANSGGRTAGMPRGYYSGQCTWSTEEESFAGTICATLCTSQWARDHWVRWQSELRLAKETQCRPDVQIWDPSFCLPNQGRVSAFMEASPWVHVSSRARKNVSSIASRFT